MQRRILIIATSWLAAVAAVWLLYPASPPPTGEVAPGYQVHVDPTTGEFVQPSPGAVPVTIDRSIADGLSTSSDGLEEVQSPLDGGGVSVELHGRFQHVAVAVVDTNGVLVAPCVSGLPARDEEGDHE